MLELYHGSEVEIVEIDLSKGHINKDFGKGFYLGESCKQAISFVSSYQNSCLYLAKLEKVKSLKIVEFDVCKEWMILVFHKLILVY